MSPDAPEPVVSIEITLVGGAATELLSSSNGDWFDFLATGVLAVHRGGVTKTSVYYSPDSWVSVSSLQPPGQPIRHMPTRVPFA